MKNEVEYTTGAIMKPVYKYMFPSLRIGNRYFSLDGNNEGIQHYYYKYANSLNDLTVEERMYLVWVERYEAKNL